MTCRSSRGTRRTKRAPRHRDRGDLRHPGAEALRRRLRRGAGGAGSRGVSGTKHQPTAGRPTFDEAVASLTAPGAEFELATETIGGVDYTVFRNLPASLRDLYDRAREDHGEKDFLVYGDTRLTYSEAWDRAAAIAHHLVHRYGVAEGRSGGDRDAELSRMGRRLHGDHLVRRHLRFLERLVVRRGARARPQGLRRQARLPR